MAATSAFATALVSVCPPERGGEPGAGRAGDLETRRTSGRRRGLAESSDHADSAAGGRGSRQATPLASISARGLVVKDQHRTFTSAGVRGRVGADRAGSGELTVRAARRVLASRKIERKGDSAMLEDFKRALARVQSDYGFYIELPDQSRRGARGLRPERGRAVGVERPRELADVLKGGIGITQLGRSRSRSPGTHDWVNRAAPERSGGDRGRRS